MSQNAGLNRRAFLKNTGLSALVGAVGPGRGVAVAAAAGAGFEAPGDTFDFDTPYNRIGTDSSKWDGQIRANGVDTLIAGMGTADLDFKVAPVITKALLERIQHENWGYLDMPRSFVDGIVRWNKQRYGIAVNPESVLITTGVHPALIAAIRAFSSPGDKVLLLTPTYNGFYGDIRAAGCEPEESQMKVVNLRYSIDFEDLERRIGFNTHTLILCNPQNPTGNVWSREDLTRVGEICTRRRVVVLADEIHCDYVAKAYSYTPYSSLDRRDLVMNSITFKAASKSFGLAAMKCGWCFSDNADYMARVRAENRTDLSTLGMIASRAAYAGGEDWLNQSVAYIEGNQEFVERYVRANIPLIKAVKAQGTYLSWLDISAVIDRIGAKEQAAEASRSSGRPVTPETIVERYLAKNAKVHMTQGASYGKGGEGHMRMNIGTSRKTLEAALSSIASVLKKT